jgi:uncharacterized membrane protein YkvA (DUF1232 family)
VATSSPLCANPRSAEDWMEKPLDGEIFGPDEQARQKSVRRDFWRTAKKAARLIPFMDEVVAAYFCAFDPQTPARVRMILIGALAYFVMPFDTIPDFLVAFGFSDDVAVLTMAITAVRGYITPAHRKAAQDALKDELE